MSDGVASFNLGADGSVEALGEIWLQRSPGRRTRGDPRRTMTLVTLGVLSDSLGMTDCGSLADGLADAWAGEDGWDTMQLIKALSATKAQIQQVPIEDKKRWRE